MVKPKAKFEIDEEEQKYKSSSFTKKVGGFKRKFGKKNFPTKTSEDT